MADTFDYDVFLSHNRADKDWVRQLAARIERETWNGRPLKVFFDEWDIQPGENFFIALERAQQKSRKVALVLVLSSDFLKSEWATAERIGTMVLSSTNEGKRVVPLLLRECELPTFLKSINWIDFSDAAQFESSYRKLLAFLREEPMPRGDVGDHAGSSLQNAPLPQPPQYGFVARYDDEGNDLVERVVNSLKQNSAVALIGSGGLGKTTLAAEIARKTLHDGMRVIWTSADGSMDFSLGTLLDEAATQLGNPDVRKKPVEEKTNEVR